MFVCGADGVAPPEGPALLRVPRKDITVDTVQRIQVIHANAHDASNALYMPDSTPVRSFSAVEIVMAAANQKIHQRMLMTNSMSFTVGFSSALMMYRTMKTIQMIIDVIPVKSM